MKITVVLADDHAIMLDGLRMILGQMSDLEVVGMAGNGREAVEMARKLCPDIVIMDIGMSDLNGMDATRQIRAADPKVKVIGLSAYADKRYVLGMLDAGASGYVHKSAAGTELLDAIRALCKGRQYLSSEIAGVVMDQCMANQTPSGNVASVALAPKEREVLQLVAEGKSSTEIGHRLKISARTVETHRRNLMAKLKLHSTAELTKYAIREGLSSLGD